jgi:hypothetical protein
MSSEVIDLTVESPLPEGIKKYWIPLDGESIPHLLFFTQYPPPRMQYYHPHDLNQLLHGEDVIDFNPNTLLTHGLPPVNLSEGYQAAIKAVPHTIHSFTLIPLSGNPVKLPTWVLDYWREIRRAMGYQHEWKKAIMWLREVSRLVNV